MLSKEKYIKQQRRKASNYIRGVKSGKIITNKWIKLAVRRYEQDLKRKTFVKKPERVDRVYHFFSLIKVNKDNKYKQFQFEPYQAFIVLNLFLFYNKDDTRRFRYLFLYIARKNGKTVFAVILNLYFLIADGEIDPQVLLLASTREQAAIALKYAEDISRNSPALRAVNRRRFELTYDRKTSSGFMKTLASKSHTIDGYNPHSAILDEIHAYENDDLFNVVKSGILQRKNPLISLITTAGFLLDSFCNEMVESSKVILSGEFKDDSFLAFLYTLDDNDNWEDWKVWGKSNPAIGSLIKLKDLKIEYNQTRIRPSSRANFKTKNLNLFVESSESWIEEEQYAKIYKDVDIELEGMDCYIAMDLSSTRDLASCTFLFEHDFYFYVKTQFFMANNPDKRVRKGGIKLDNWIDAGYITMCDTKRIDYDLIFEFISNESEIYNIRSCQYDKFNSSLIVPRLECIGIECIEFPQTAPRFNFPLKFMEKVIYDEKISIGQNPVLRWNFRNVVLYIDGNENIKIMKNKSLDSVDGVVSLGMAFGGWIADNFNEEKQGLENYLKS